MTVLWSWKVRSSCSRVPDAVRCGVLAGTSGPRRCRVRQLEVLETCLYGRDLEAMETFYSEVFGLEKLTAKEGRHVFFRCGGSMLLVFNPDATSDETSAPPHGAEGPGHVAFAVAPDELDVWRHRLEAHGVEIEAEGDWRRDLRSLYVRDPAGNSVELAPPQIWGLEDGER
jgi:catechol 2,3-dioxygenase-like lactoylglutathione lyase family enzyme